MTKNLINPESPIKTENSGTEIFTAMHAPKEESLSGEVFASEYGFNFDIENPDNAIRRVLIGEGHIIFDYANFMRIEMIHSIQNLSWNLIDYRKGIVILQSYEVIEFLELDEDKQVVLVNTTFDLLGDKYHTRKVPVNHTLFQFVEALLNAKTDDACGVRIYETIKPTEEVTSDLSQVLPTSL